MRILMLAPRAPYPADHGTALRNLHLLQWLGSRHEVTLFTHGDPNNAVTRHVLEKSARHIELYPEPRRTLADRLHTLVRSGEPDLARRLWSASLVSGVQRLLQNEAIELVQIEGLEMYAIWQDASRGFGGTQPLVVLDDHNAEYALQDSAWRASVRRGQVSSTIYSLIQSSRLRSFERAAGEACDGVLAVSSEDKQSLQALGGNLRLAVVPNGVDTTEYRPEPGVREEAAALFIGKLDYRPNVDAIEWLAQSIWPRIRELVPQAQLFVVGRDPLPRVQALASEPGITIVGPVADDRPWFARATALLVPMRMGGGVRLKVLQALAMGTPLVSTSIGMAGTEAVDESHFLRADDPAAFARQTARVFGDSVLRARLAAAGRRFVCERFDWQVILPRLEEFYQQIRSTCQSV
jgi:glycosyltransferase involved in cell wall biosynthesis